MNAITQIEPKVADMNISTARPRVRWLRSGAMAVALLLLLATWWLLHRSPQTPIAAAPHVGVAVPLAREIVEWDTDIGRFAPSQSVEVRPRVAGAIVGLHFRDGDVVHG